jgi:hypothetical protein
MTRSLGAWSVRFVGSCIAGVVLTACPVLGDGGCNDGAVSGRRAGIEYLFVCGQVFEFDANTPQLRYLGVRDDPATLAALIVDAEELEDVAGEEPLTRPLGWGDLRMKTDVSGILVWNGESPSAAVAVPVREEGVELGKSHSGPLRVGQEVRFCGSATGFVSVEFWQARYRNPAGTSRLRVRLREVAACE